MLFSMGTGNALVSQAPISPLEFFFKTLTQIMPDLLKIWYKIIAVWILTTHRQPRVSKIS